MNKRQIGNVGEDYIAQLLQRKGFRLLQRNFYIRGGEIDLILEKQGKLIFVEVKTRSGNEFGSAFDSITAKKKQHLRRAAELYMQMYEKFDREVEFWAAAVHLDAGGRIAGYEIIDNIFD